jgi:protein SFI1
MTWHSNTQEKRRLAKQAKLVRRLFLERTTWRKWKFAIDAKRREENLQKFEKKRLKAAWKIWIYKARKARNDRRKEAAVSCTISTRIMRRAFDTWMQRVLFIKNREYDVKMGYQEKLTRYVTPCFPTCAVDLDALPSVALVKWHTKFRHHQENTSLMQSFVDVRHEGIHYAERLYADKLTVIGRGPAPAALGLGSCHSVQAAVSRSRRGTAAFSTPTRLGIMARSLY